MSRLWKLGIDVSVGAVYKCPSMKFPIVLCADGEFYVEGDPARQYIPSYEEWLDKEWYAVLGAFGNDFSYAIRSVAAGTPMRRKIWEEKTFLAIQGLGMYVVQPDGSGIDYIVGNDWLAYDWEEYKE